MTDSKDDSEDLPHADLYVEFGDGSGFAATDRVRMWFDTFNAALQAEASIAGGLAASEGVASDASRMQWARAAATMAHGFVPSIYRGPR